MNLAGAENNIIVHMSDGDVLAVEHVSSFVIIVREESFALQIEAIDLNLPSFVRSEVDEAVKVGLIRHVIQAWLSRV